MTASFVLDGAELWIGDGSRTTGHIVVANGRVAAVEAGAYRGPLPRQDLTGLALSPGMVDLMVLGGFNRSILRDDPGEIARAYLRRGVTSCQFCIGTLPWDAMQRIAANIAAARQRRDADAADILGLYAEGPFQLPHLTGASQKQYALPPTPEHVDRLLQTGGTALSMVNVAPGWDGDVAAVQQLRRAGKVVSMAHSDAACDRVLACLDAGTTVLGHAFDNNAGRTGDSGVQQPTLEHVALLDPRVRAIHVIADGVHVHPWMVRLILKCRGVEAVCLVTDGVSRAGCEDGPFQWDDGRMFYKKGGVGRTTEGWLCGSALLLPDHLRNLVRFTGLDPWQAIRTVTLNPAASLGLDDRIGKLAPGRAADLVAWDQRLQVRRVWRHGVEVADVHSQGEVDVSTPWHA